VVALFHYSDKIRTICFCMMAFAFAPLTRAQVPSEPFPTVIAMCEDTDGCSEWAFQGKQGTGKWAFGAVAKLVVEHFDATTVTIHRTDSSGADTGLNAIYTGTRTGHLVEGTVSWAWPGHPAGKTNWHAILAPPPQASKSPSEKNAPPSHASFYSFCEDTGNACDGPSPKSRYIWSLESGHGLALNLDAPQSHVELTEDDSKDGKLVFLRRDLVGPTAGVTGIYVGTKQGTFIRGTVILIWPGHWNDKPLTGKWAAIPDPNGATRWSAILAGPAPLIPLGKIIDVVLPEAPFHPKPPPTPAFHPLAKQVAAFDLNGTWERDQTPPGSIEKASVLQLRDLITVRNLGVRAYFIPNAILANSRFTSPTIATGETGFDDRGDYRVKYQPGNLTVIDADHFRLDHIGLYHRTSKASVTDIPCDPKKPSTLSAEDAFERGDAFRRGNDQITANCWLYVAALADNAEAEASYAESLMLGLGVEKDPDQAFVWAQRSGMHGNYLGASMLAKIFDEGIGAPPSEQRHAYWLAHMFGLSPGVVHDAHNNTTRNWMLDYSTPCELTNPDHLSAMDALKRGRVAYQARALQTAHCWFRISAEQGNTKAWTYLGLQSAFGMGVRENTKNGFNYMAQAAKDGDVYARVYLANFYRYGIGTPVDEGAGGAIISIVMRNAEGQDAFAHVQGTFLNTDQSLAAGIQLAVDADQEQSCREAAEYQRQHPGEPQQHLKCSDAAADAIMRGKDSAHHTIDTPEELYPEKPMWIQ
jgi:TPR repeat protein